jgi:ferrous iron transport protein B
MKYQKIALVGNPNTGKTSLFNALTGLNQQVGNFPGVTVDKKVGKIKSDDATIEIIDLPGTYSIYPRSKDEEVVYSILSNSDHKDYPDAVCVIVDAANLERNLLLFKQVYQLGLPTFLVLNMSDVAFKKGKKINLVALQENFPDAKIIETNARIKSGIKRLLDALTSNFEKRTNSSSTKLIPLEEIEEQQKDTEKKFEEIRSLMQKISIDTPNSSTYKVSKLDRFFTHPIWGYFTFLLTLLVLFQLVFTLAAYPMDLIDQFISELSVWTSNVLPQGLFVDLLANGIIPGIGGVLVFIPQIALLFIFIAILEETGYMSRVVFIMDRLMRPFGLNGKSVVPLLSSAACAIPGVMASRTISNWKERLITILVAPLISCSARIPVYTLLISLVIPKSYLFGFINVQGLVFFNLYFLGFFSALAISFVLKLLIQNKEESVLMLELPELKAPRWFNVLITVIEKVKLFFFDAGKVIVAISILLWFLGSYGPSERRNIAIQKVPVNQNKIEYDRQIEAVKFENSYIGIVGKKIEPIIQPLGYDWKIGVSLITSFAAREVFVGSMATIYSVEVDEEKPKPLLDKMRAEKNDLGKPVYTVASGLSLMVFYVYAMQCMATFAVVKRETNSWKWPIIQVIFMGGLAYLASFITFNIFQ